MATPFDTPYGDAGASGCDSLIGRWRGPTSP
jgi:hypothetical protein